MLLLSVLNESEFRMNFFWWWWRSNLIEKMLLKVEMKDATNIRKFLILFISQLMTSQWIALAPCFYVLTITVCDLNFLPI